METKICKECEAEKPIKEFRKYSDGYIANKCKKCQNKPIVSSIIGKTMPQKCARCGKPKKRKDFYPDKRRPKGISSICKKCASLERKNDYIKNKQAYKKRNRNNHLKSKYGITTMQYDEMLINQNYCCEICSRHVDKIKNKKLYVDHNHNTNKVRGLICGSCNRLIALAVENKVILKNAIIYLKKYNNE